MLLSLPAQQQACQPTRGLLMLLGLPARLHARRPAGGLQQQLGLGAHTSSCCSWPPVTVAPLPLLLLVCVCGGRYRILQEAREACMALPADLVGWAAESFIRPPMICVAPSKSTDERLRSWNEAIVNLHIPEAVKGSQGYAVMR